MDYITKLSKETDASIHTYILLGLINHWEKRFLINLQILLKKPEKVIALFQYIFVLNLEEKSQFLIMD